MIKKRLFALAMATVMMLSTSVVAFAEQTTTVANISSTLSTSVEATGEMNPVSIKVTVPTSTEFVINPYKLSAEVGGATKSLQVYSPDYTITNVGDVALQVDAVIAGEVKGNLTFASNTVASNSTKNEAFLFVNFKRALSDDVTTAITESTKFDKDGIVKVDSHDDGKTYYAVDKSLIVADGDDYVLTEAAAAALSANDWNYTVTSKNVTVTENSVKKTYTLETYKILAEGEYDKSATQGAVTAKDTTYKNMGTIYTAAQISAVDTLEEGDDKLSFSISGSTAVNPTKVWTESDGATVTIKFNFTPVIVEVESDN
jgi:hypothetical protein